MSTPCELESRSWRVYSIQRYVIKFAVSRWFSLDSLVSSTNRIDLHDITEILLKVALHIRTLTHPVDKADDCLALLFINFTIDLICNLLT